MANIGAPGSGLPRREFIAASTASGAAAVAGCIDTATDGTDTASPETTATTKQTMPTTGPPQAVNVDEQGDEVTLRTIHARHDAHPLDSMGGPVELPRVWAFQADDR